MEKKNLNLMRSERQSSGIALAVFLKISLNPITYECLQAVAILFHTSLPIFFHNEQDQGKEGKIVHSHGIKDSMVIPHSEDGSLLSA